MQILSEYWFYSFQDVLLYTWRFKWIQQKRNPFSSYVSRSDYCMVIETFSLHILKQEFNCKLNHLNKVGKNAIPIHFILAYLYLEKNIIMECKTFSMFTHFGVYLWSSKRERSIRSFLSMKIGSFLKGA